MTHTYFLIPLADIDRMAPRDLVDCLRFDNASPVTSHYDDFAMFRLNDPKITIPAITRWFAHGGRIMSWSTDIEKLDPDMTAPEPISGANMGSLVGALRSMLEAFDTGKPARTAPQRAAMEQAAQVLNEVARLGVRVFTK